MLPKSAIVYLTNYCQLKCNHCLFSDYKQLNTNELDYETIKLVIDDFKKNKVFMVAYTGGDPLMHSKIFDILQYTYNNGILPLLGISGIGITNDIAQRIKMCKVGCVQVSLDGSSEAINSIYRGKGSFNEIINSIKILKKNDINVNLAICLSQENFCDYKNLIGLAESLNIYRLKVVFWKNYNNNCKFHELGVSS